MRSKLACSSLVRLATVLSVPRREIDGVLFFWQVTCAQVTGLSVTFAAAGSFITFLYACEQFLFSPDVANAKVGGPMMDKDCSELKNTVTLRRGERIFGLNRNDVTVERVCTIFRLHSGADCYLIDTTTHTCVFATTNRDFSEKKKNCMQIVANRIYEVGGRQADPNVMSLSSSFSAFGLRGHGGYHRFTGQSQASPPIRLASSETAASSSAEHSSTAAGQPKRNPHLKTILFAVMKTTAA